MKHPILLAISASLLAGAALAGSTEAPVFPVTQIAPPAAADWSGFYAGGMVSFDSSDRLQFFEDGNPQAITALTSVTSFGGFAGYNIQSGSMVYGAELAISSGGLYLTAAPDSHYQAVYDLKARVGYSFGNVLAYGVIGGSFSNLDQGVIEQYASSGFTYGAGVDYQFNQHMFVGVEYLVRDLSGAAATSPGLSTSATIQSAQLRVGWKF